ncbi:MAG: aldo/keto reductase, partial [Calditrichia bacterium]
IAKRKNVTPAQLALAWVMARGEYIVPIPGTKHRKYVEENAAAAEVKLSQDELAEISRALPQGAAAGLRYPKEVMNLVNG